MRSIHLRKFPTNKQLVGGTYERFKQQAEQSESMPVKNLRPADRV